ncbi:hypothetical protein NEOLI_003816 [Neolecta irregularis DAH-3]|uniref:Uncharacterized protein n=1 Tax=Neolecta irregularis (strain DAH-3) TaxID=1198029 RepID=A0A1U7LV90_NEOID|nr:hypothetical protein NEOLI_003816 [Neolecta irregularis DAH-3]|eukprot:OLL26590.1 hypothetical protein NEOLI_003816 [Neolecta irregularis DAH-3]
MNHKDGAPNNSQKVQSWTVSSMPFNARRTHNYENNFSFTPALTQHQQRNIIRNSWVRTEGKLSQEIANDSSNESEASETQSTHSNWEDLCSNFDSNSTCGEEESPIFKISIGDIQSLIANDQDEDGNLFTSQCINHGEVSEYSIFSVNHGFCGKEERVEHSTRRAFPVLSQQTAHYSNELSLFNNADASLFLNYVSYFDALSRNGKSSPKSPTTSQSCISETSSQSPIQLVRQFNIKEESNSRYRLDAYGLTSLVTALLLTSCQHILDEAEFILDLISCEPDVIKAIVFYLFRWRKLGIQRDPCLVLRGASIVAIKRMASSILRREEEVLQFGISPEGMIFASELRDLEICQKNWAEWCEKWEDLVKLVNRFP